MPLEAGKPAVQRLEAMERARASADKVEELIAFLGDAPLFDAERALLARLRPVLRLLVPLRLVDFRPADFALEVPRDDFLVVAIHALRVSR